MFRMRSPWLLALLLAAHTGVAEAAPEVETSAPASAAAAKPKAAKPQKVKRPGRRPPASAKGDPRKDRQNWPVRRPATPPYPLQVPAMGTIPFPQGERLQYKVNMLGIDAGEVMLGVGNRSKLGSVPVVPLVGWVRVRAPRWRSSTPSTTGSRSWSTSARSCRCASTSRLDEQGNRVEYETVYNQAGKFILTTRSKAQRREGPRAELQHPRVRSSTR
jgi:hypothetical protein